MSRAVLATLMPGFVGNELPDWLAARLRDGLGGICLFRENVKSVEQIRALCDQIYAANPDAVIAIDEEGGDVTRLYLHVGAPFPGAAVLGRLGDLDLTERVGAQVGWEMRAVGIGLTFAPVADVNSNPNNPVIGVRSFGAEPGPVADHVAAWVRGVQSTGVAGCAKHFPGHGDTSQDSHLSLPSIDADETQVRHRELVPFAAAIRAGVKTIMTSHILFQVLDPKQPATFSPDILGRLLRDELGFTGVAVSDALDMVGASGEIGIPAAAGRALAGGCDLLCIGTNNNDEQIGKIVLGIKRAAAAGILAMSQLEDAGARVHALGAQLRAGREGAGPPASFTPGRVPGLDTARVRKVFHISAHGHDFLSRNGGKTDGLSGGGNTNGNAEWIRLASEGDIAAGVSPWQPIGGGIEHAVSVGPDDNPLAAVTEGAKVIVVGKNLHQHAWAGAAIRALHQHASVLLVVDMGWPKSDFEGVDVATFGSSRLVCEALRELVE